MGGSENIAAPRRDRLIGRFIDACSSDERISAAFIGGSVARGEPDGYSDLDLCVVVGDARFDDVLADRRVLASRLGTPLFCEDWGDEDPELFVILDDGSDVELFFVRESRLHEVQAGAIRPLLDRRGILTDLDLPIRHVGSDELVDELRRILAWFWHDVSHFITAVGRDQIWWAAGQVEALRGYCVNLVRIEQGEEAGNEPYWKIDAETSTVALESLRSTFVPIELGAMAQAASDLVAFFGTRGRAAADLYGVAYPGELERLLRDQLNELRVSTSAIGSP
jgi:predicted nucleotidyltransferase